MNAEKPIHSAGEELGPYVLERLLGRGAAAEVWQAVETGDLGFRKRQALKLLRPPPGEMEAQKKALITEARVCGHLKHPGVVDVYRVGDQDGEIYVAMEFVDGPDLNTLLEGLREQRIAIPLPVCLDMGIEICDALHHAHTARGDDGRPLDIVHRDLKPSNILVDRRGVLKISDWGLVKSTLNVESTTRGVVKGTPGYIAPEVWGGTRDFRPSVDLFAVGAMLFEFVVGERLFQGRNLARIAEQVARRTPAEEAARVAERAPALVPVVEKLLQRVPSERFQSADAVSTLLRELRSGLAEHTSLKDFLRDVGHVVERLAPAVTGTGRVGADPELPVATPVLDADPLAPTASLPRVSADQDAPTVADGPGPEDDGEHPTDPNLATLKAPPKAPKQRPAPPEPKRPRFEAPSTVAVDPSTLPKSDAASAFGESGPMGTRGGDSQPVGATRSMAPVSMPGTPAGPAQLGAPAGAIDTVGEGSERRRKRKRKRPPGAAATGGAPRKRRRKGPPPKPVQKGPSKAAMAIVLIGVALLAVGVVLFLTR